MSQLPERVSFPAGADGGACPNCGAGGTRVVYAVSEIPIHSCVLLASREQATGFPTGDMRWAFCAACTFLFNASFDPALIDYSSDYEETQGHSATFSRWLKEVAGTLVERHGLRKKRVVEVGCGRGDFLELVCRIGDNSGIGVDPSETAGRVDHGAGAGLTFLHESFGPRQRDLAADAIVCRHTLEHIQDARGLLRDVRGALAPDGIAFFELPDVERQLAEGAFWDIYYEHCAYYGEASLRALFEASGFTVLAIERVYGNQYLQITARRADRKDSGGAPRAARPPAPVRTRWEAAVERFSETCAASIGAWNTFRRARAEDRESVVLWGSGSKATGFLTTLGWSSRPGGLEHVVDINPDKWNRYVAGAGQRIVEPRELTRLQPRHVVIMNPIYVQEIGADLARLGCSPQLHSLGV